MIKNRPKKEPTLEKNQVTNHKIFCADPVGQKIEKMSAPEGHGDFWASKITAQMAVGRDPSLHVKANLPSLGARRRTRACPLRPSLKT